MRPSLLIAAMIALICATNICPAQEENSSDKITDFPNKLFGKIDARTKDLNSQLQRQTEKYLLRLEKREEKLKRKLYKQDSAKASALFANDPQGQYARLIQKMKTDSIGASRSMGPQYLPYVDSLNSSLAFLNKNPQLLNSSPAMSAQMQASLVQLQQLQARMQNADVINQFILQRKQQISQYLSGQANLPPGVKGIFSDYKKQLYYYKAQVNYYRDVLNDPDKMLTTALSLLNKLPAFATFMKSNSFLAGMFGVPGNYGSADGLVGMQTRDQITNLIQSQVSSGGPNAAASIQSSLQTASQDINSIQNKISSMGAGSGNMDMPDFKPNNQRTKTFLKRLEYGTTLQTQPSSFYFPATIDIGLTLGYKLNDRNTSGVGASYKAGCGKDWRHIQVSSQGVGLRSYFEFQAKKSIYITGGFEYNYQPVDPTLKIDKLSDWTRSGLIGLSKSMSMHNKYFKATKVQLLWDFLSYSQVPIQQPFKFRVGYTF